MRFRALAVLPLLVCSIAAADEASHREAAFRILDITKGERSMQTGLKMMIDPIVAGMKQSGMPEEAVQEVKQAINEWFVHELKWADLKPKIAGSYMQHFTEPELKELLAFYQTPTGQKALEKLPLVTKEGSEISIEYVKGKQESLKGKLREIAAKYPSKNEQ